MPRFRPTLAPWLLAALVSACVGRAERDETEAVPPKSIEQVLAAHNDSLMAISGVVGTAIGRCDGAPCIRVFLADASAVPKVPERLGGYPVRVEVTGLIRPRE